MAAIRMQPLGTTRSSREHGSSAGTHRNGTCHSFARQELIPGTNLDCPPTHAAPQGETVMEEAARHPSQWMANQHIVEKLANS